MRLKSFEVRIKADFMKCLVIGGFMILCGNNMSGQTVRFASSTISLEGNSMGGTLTLIKASSGNPPYLILTNQLNETAASVIYRLGQQLSGCSLCREFYGVNPIAVSNSTITLQGGLLNNKGSVWALGGNETGFNIPSCPKALTASYNSNGISLQWQNPSQGYDSIAIIFMGIPWISLNANASQYFDDWKKSSHAGFPDTDVVYQLVGFKNGVPSNVIGLRLKNHTLQEAIFNAPFSSGIAQGFETWTGNLSTNYLKFDQGNLPGVKAESDMRPLRGKGFYQIVSGHDAFCGGVLRHFIGLTSGHTYRLSAQLNVLETVGNDWMFSFHATANSRETLYLSEAQLSGHKVLPNGLKGPTAAQIAKLDSTSSKGEWLTRTSNENTNDNIAGDITLPPGSDSITVWFRLEGKNASKAAVGIDSVTIEDLGIR